MWKKMIKPVIFFFTLLPLFLEVVFFLSDFKAKTVYNGGEYKQNGIFLCKL